MNIRKSKNQLTIKGDNYTLSWKKADKYYVDLKFKSGIGAKLFVPSSCDTIKEIDKCVSVSAPSVRKNKKGVAFVSFSGKSTVWTKKKYIFECREDTVLYSYEVEGKGAIDNGWFFEGFLDNDPKLEKHGYPWFCADNRDVGYSRTYKHFARSSEPGFEVLYTPSINSADIRHQMYYENATLRVDGSRTYQGGDWLTSPPPFCYLMGNKKKKDWVSMGLCVKDGENNFLGYRYFGGEGFGLNLDYMGYTHVKGKWASPKIVFQASRGDYQGFKKYVSFLFEEGYRKKVKRRTAKWWKRPIFCGWGEQVYLSDRWQKFLKGEDDYKVDIPALCTQKLYSSLLKRLEKEGIDPGTIIIDYRWFKEDDEFTPDPKLWPDMKGFIKQQHDKGRRVVLWSSPFSHSQASLGKKIPRDECILAYDGNQAEKARMNIDIHYPHELMPDFHTDVLYPVIGGKKRFLKGGKTTKKLNPIFVDPTSPKYEKRLRRLVRKVISPEGLDADGFKFDYTHFLPQIRDVKMHKPAWGVELLKQLLDIYSDEARKVKPDSFMITHTFNPYFTEVVDMCRLQDLYTDDKSVVEMMKHRAAIARIACPGCLIDADNHPLVSLEAWDEYARVQPSIGVPALYYVSGIETTHEKLEKKHFKMIKRTWEEYEQAHG